MSLTLDIEPEIESRLLAQAHARGISLSEFAMELLTTAAELGRSSTSQSTEPQADNLYDLFTPVRGLLTDEEVDRYFTRTPSASRPVDFG